MILIAYHLLESSIGAYIVLRKMETRQGYGMGIGGCNRLCSAANGA